MTLQPFRLISLLLATLLVSGCLSSGYRVQVDAINDPAAMPALRTYTIASGAKELDPASLQFREATALLRGVLTRRGYIEAPRPEEAALRITFSYGIGRAETRTVTHSTPVYAELGGGRVQTVTKNTDASGKTTTSTHTTVLPGRYERVGNDVTTSTHTFYPKHLMLSARETNTLSTANPEIWSINAVFQSERADLRADLPILVTAIEPYIGENTGHAIAVRVVDREGQLVIEPTK